MLTTSLQYALRLDEKVFDHRTAGNEFTAIKRNIEIVLSRREISKKGIKEIRTDHDHTSKNHSLVRKQIWDNIKEREKRAMEEDRIFIESVCVQQNANQPLDTNGDSASAPSP